MTQEKKKASSPAGDGCADFEPETSHHTHRRCSGEGLSDEGQAIEPRGYDPEGSLKEIVRQEGAST
eukprot:12923486-Prorocentrum_lima.AAC.1